MDVLVKDIVWDTEQEDGERPDQDELGLPRAQVIVAFDEILELSSDEIDEDDAVDYVSDAHGFCISSCDVRFYDEGEAEQLVADAEAAGICK